jgi:hypothetical protein
MAGNALQSRMKQSPSSCTFMRPMKLAAISEVQRYNAHSRTVSRAACNILKGISSFFSTVRPEQVARTVIQRAEHTERARVPLGCS